MKIYKLTYFLFCSMLFCAVSSCTTVELCPETEHPHIATILAEYDWGEYEANKPAKMNIVASRILNTWRSHGIADTQTGYVASGTSADTKVTPEHPEEQPQPAEEAFKLKGGEYNLLTINTYTGLSIDNLQSYINHPEAAVDTLFLHLEETSRNDLPELKGIDMPDFNPKYKYIQNAGQIFYGTERGVVIHTGQTETVHFKVTPVSQPITIKFKVKTIGEVQVDSLIAEISGVCGRMNISEAFLDTSNLYRIIFQPEVDKKEGDLITYKAQLHVLGVIPSLKESYLIGPGIIQVAVYASSGKKRRIYYAGANPRQNIIDAKLTEKREDGKTYLVNTEPVTIELDGELKIDANQILNREDNNFDIWFDSDINIDVDV